MKEWASLSLCLDQRTLEAESHLIFFFSFPAGYDFLGNLIKHTSIFIHKLSLREFSTHSLSFRRYLSPDSGTTKPPTPFLFSQCSTAMAACRYPPFMYTHPLTHSPANPPTHLSHPPSPCSDPILTSQFRSHSSSGCHDSIRVWLLGSWDSHLPKVMKSSLLPQFLRVPGIPVVSLPLWSGDSHVF